MSTYPDDPSGFSIHASTPLPWLENPTKVAAAKVYEWRCHLNAQWPCVIMAVDASSEGLIANPYLEPPAPGAFRIDLTQGGVPVTAANLAAALGQRDVANAAALLVDVAAGRASNRANFLCQNITNVVFSMASHYPLNRPDTSRHPAGSPS